MLAASTRCTSDVAGQCADVMDDKPAPEETSSLVTQQVERTDECGTADDKCMTLPAVRH